MHPIEEDLKRRIKRHYELFDPDEKIYLDGPAKDIIEPAFLEYEKEILNFIKRENEKIDEEIEVKEEFYNLEELEIIEEKDLISEEQIFDIEILSQIEKKVNEVIVYFDLSLYRKDEDKERLKNLIVEDMLDRYINFHLTDKMKESIIKVVRDTVDHEFKEYQLKKKIRLKDLFEELREKIWPDLENIISNHKKNKIHSITKSQIENFLKYLIEYIDNKYIKIFKREKKLNNEDYLFLKNLIEKFIIKKYR